MSPGRQPVAGHLVEMIVVFETEYRAGSNVKGVATCR
jgi:hypothetical protein